MDPQRPLHQDVVTCIGSRFCSMSLGSGIPAGGDVRNLHSRLDLGSSARDCTAVVGWGGGGRGGRGVGGGEEG